MIDSTVKRPVCRYHGSKFRLAPWIASFIQPHITYAETHGGSAAVLLRKERSTMEIYNDLDHDIVNLFRTLRDEGDRNRLAIAVALTPFSREEYRDCFDGSGDRVEQARALVARSFFGFASHSHNINNITNGFRTSGTKDGKRIKDYAREWLGVPENLMAVAERMRGVVIEQLDAFEFIPKYDGADTFFYVDPPYVRSARDDRSKGYAHEMSDRDHEKLAWMLHQVKGKVLLSGYYCELYARLYPDWHRETKETMANGQAGSSARTEVLWMNYSPVPQ
jgi:DNA adenine methylase